MLLYLFWRILVLAESSTHMVPLLCVLMAMFAMGLFLNTATWLNLVTLVLVDV